MKTALLAALAGLLLFAAAPAFAQTADSTEAAGVTCEPVQAPAQTAVDCVARGLAPASAVDWSVSLPGNALAEGTGAADAEGRSGFRFVTGAAAGPYLASATGTAADQAPFSAEVAGTVVAPPTPAGPVSAGFGPGPGSTALVIALLAAALAFTAVALRPCLLRLRR